MNEKQFVIKSYRRYIQGKNVFFSQVIINISSKSYELFHLCVDLGYIDFMVNELESDDILYQLNILELLSQLAIKPHGINYLIKQGTLLKISELVKKLHENAFGGLLIPGKKRKFVRTNPIYLLSSF